MTVVPEVFYNPAIIPICTVCTQPWSFLYFASNNWWWLRSVKTSDGLMMYVEVSTSWLRHRVPRCRVWMLSDVLNIVLCRRPPRRPRPCLRRRRPQPTVGPPSWLPSGARSTTTPAATRSPPPPPTPASECPTRRRPGSAASPVVRGRCAELKPAEARSVDWLLMWRVQTTQHNTTHRLTDGTLVYSQCSPWGRKRNRFSFVCVFLMLDRNWWIFFHIH